MATTDKLFAGSIPELYERFLVPLIFEPYACDLAKRVADTAPKDVLETAAGTGVLTRAMAARLPAAVRIVATDLNQPMLDQRRSGRPEIPGSNGGRLMRWRCPFRPQASASSCANSGRCSSSTRSRGTRKRGGFCDPAAISFSMYGTGSQKMNSPTWSRKRWR